MTELLLAAIERALGISGIRTNVSAWSHKEAQIDMLIERADDVVSIIEIKFSDAENQYASELVDAQIRLEALLEA